MKIKCKSLQEVEKEISRLSDEVRADDPRFNNVVIILTVEGSSMLYHNAFIWEVIDKSNYKWIAVITEHYGDRVFAWDELTSYRQFRPLKDVQKITLT